MGMSDGPALRGSFMPELVSLSGMVVGMFPTMLWLRGSHVGSGQPTAAHHHHEHHGAAAGS
jgi:hypothetical protein